MKELLSEAELMNERERVEKQVEHCTRKISKYDKQVSKLYHQIEFDNRYNASKGYKAYDDLRKVLIHRRDWKDARPKLVKELKMINIRLEKLQKSKQRKVEKICRKKDWSKKFSPEANAILKGVTI